MYRAQILLAEGQYERLRRIALGERRSVSDLMREMVDQEIDRREQAESLRRDGRLAALDRLTAERGAILERRGGRTVDLVGIFDDLRDERDRDLLEGHAGGR